MPNPTNNTKNENERPAPQIPLVDDVAKRVKMGQAMLMKYWGVKHVSGMHV